MSRYIKVSEFKLFDTVDMKFVDIMSCEKPVNVDVLGCYWSYGDCQTYTERSLFGDVKAVYTRVTSVSFSGVTVEVLSFTKYRVTVLESEPVVIDLGFHFIAATDSFLKEVCKEISRDIEGVAVSELCKLEGCYTASCVLDRLHGLRYEVLKPSQFDTDGWVDDLAGLTDEYASVGLFEFKVNIETYKTVLSSIHNVFILGAYAVLLDDDFNFAALANVSEINSKKNCITIGRVLYSINEEFTAEVKKIADEDAKRWQEVEELSGDSDYMTLCEQHWG